MLKAQRRHRFVQLLEAFSDFSDDARAALAAERPNVTDDASLREVYEQWRAAFSYSPGRIEAYPLILALARKIAAYSNESKQTPYAEQEWHQLILLRGRTDIVSVRICQRCLAQRVSAGFGGFTSESGAACNRCGNVLIYSFYDERPFPKCDCGGEYHEAPTSDVACDCGSMVFYIDDVSGYEYFESHAWKLNPRQ